ncbi:hypothetical protein AZI86_14295 [Bdellovibrio bacteriovorus]|uniref:Bdellovibrio beta-sandwich domain-containing protein n=1 Tax=Bdellovibrio bacteriovorus TaxID=959 RepID=A0A150WJT8_BDEBC|nr:hypothetical protein [Bdellovibrio bacteriovorus]KYG63976.1 hypothetical protein AZI86_14295 [Bdellovibrio bacteriovorus]
MKTNFLIYVMIAFAQTSAQAQLMDLPNPFDDAASTPTYEVEAPLSIGSEVVFIRNRKYDIGLVVDFAGDRVWLRSLNSNTIHEESLDRVSVKTAQCSSLGYCPSDRVLSRYKGIESSGGAQLGERYSTGIVLGLYKPNLVAIKDNEDGRIDIKEQNSVYGKDVRCDAYSSICVGDKINSSYVSGRPYDYPGTVSGVYSNGAIFIKNNGREIQVFLDRNSFKFKQSSSQ